VPRLARGYRNRPEQTAAAYVPNPWFEASTAALMSSSSGGSSSDPAAAALREHYRLAYRTSDLVVMGEDGQVGLGAVPYVCFTGINHCASCFSVQYRCAIQLLLLPVHVVSRRAM
jgi:hypothetical protein